MRAPTTFSKATAFSSLRSFLMQPRSLMGLAGLVVVALAIWFIGPYLALGALRPFDPVLNRIIAIAVVSAIWLLLWLLRWNRARRASARLESAISGAATVDDDEAAERLRLRFAEAIQFLRQSRKNQNLYELPWYVIVGPPGSGKTTALLHSGLNFPLDERFGKDALRGVGGTRNCDWWFTDEAVLLDTAGRYFTQDSQADSDAGEWRDFLDLLMRYRKRRPINGVLVTLSAEDLLTQSAEARERHVRTVRRRIDELQTQLKIQIPVYFLVTKCDLIAGFVEFFDDLGHEGRTQVWGATHPQPVAGGRFATWFRGEYEALLERLDQRLLSRLDQEREPRRRSRLFGFPLQMASLRDALTDFIRDTFEGTGFDRPVMLRGVYFTSGTQEGTPIDRMMDGLLRAYRMNPVAAAPAGPAGRGEGRSYFIHQLLKDVVFPESGLAGVNWRFEVRRAVAQNIAYVAVLAVVGILATAWYASYRSNAAYLDDVSATLQTHTAMATQPVPGVASLRDVLPTLDALSEIATVANRHRGDVPRGMTLGLYRGQVVGVPAEEAYLQGVRQLLIPRLVHLLEGRLRAPGPDPTVLYAYLKAYLMMAEPQRLEADELNRTARSILLQEFSDQRTVAEALAVHFAAYTNSGQKLPVLKTDEVLVARARASLRQASVPTLMLTRLEDFYDQAHPMALRLDVVAGLGSDQVFSRRSGTPLDAPVPALFTREGFLEITGNTGSQLIDRFLQDRWVFGPDTLPTGPTARIALVADFERHYEEAYVRYWDQLLSDLRLVPLADVNQAVSVLAAMTSFTSPLRRLAETIDAQLHLPVPEREENQRGPAQLGDLPGLRVAAGDPDRFPGARINAHFSEMHRFVAGANGAVPLDQLINLLERVYQDLVSLGGGLAGQDAMAVLGRQGSDSLRRLRTDSARYPVPFNGWFGELAGSGEQVALQNLRTELNQRLQSDVATQCRELAANRYPFNAGSDRDIALSDFARLFGTNGVMDGFFNEHLRPLVDLSGNRWRWRDGEVASLGLSQNVLDQFQRARLIRDLFLSQGGSTPSLGFELTPHYLDAQVREFALTLGTQSLNYRHGPPLTSRFTWPPEITAPVTVVFEDRGGQRPNLRFEGPWGWFRALDGANPTAESDTAFLTTFKAGDYTAQILLRFDSSRNPLRNADWKRFQCPTGL